ncbi:MAG: hypothetical protein BWY67_01898 [Bacteroidetes bacterium ADurb.Bin397]|nr:MAG: hypothetical protein BWY67_01898 [Bacteroidetes bacterium ADurb.Bin397]
MSTVTGPVKAPPVLIALIAAPIVPYGEPAVAPVPPDTTICAVALNPSTDTNINAVNQRFSLVRVLLFCLIDFMN